MEEQIKVLKEYAENHFSNYSQHEMLRALLKQQIQSNITALRIEEHLANMRRYQSINNMHLNVLINSLNDKGISNCRVETPEARTKIENSVQITIGYEILNLDTVSEDELKKYIELKSLKVIAKPSEEKDIYTVTEINGHMISFYDNKRCKWVSSTLGLTFLLYNPSVLSEKELNKMLIEHIENN